MDVKNTARDTIVLQAIAGNVGQTTTDHDGEAMPELSEGTEEAEEAMYVAVFNYLSATSESAERYPKAYSRKQKRGLRRKAKRCVTHNHCHVCRPVFLMAAQGEEIESFASLL